MNSWRTNLRSSFCLVGVFSVACTGIAIGAGLVGLGGWWRALIPVLAVIVVFGMNVLADWGTEP